MQRRNYLAGADMDATRMALQKAGFELGDDITDGIKERLRLPND